MILDGTSLSIQVCLDAGKSTNDMDVSLDYLLWNTTGGPTKPASTRVATNGTTDVTVLGAGSISANFVADILHMSVYNKDTASKTATVKIDTGSSEFIEVKQLLQVGESLTWDKGFGWRIL